MWEFSFKRVERGWWEQKIATHLDVPFPQTSMKDILDPSTVLHLYCHDPVLNCYHLSHRYCTISQQLSTQSVGHRPTPSVSPGSLTEKQISDLHTRNFILARSPGYPYAHEYWKVMYLAVPSGFTFVPFQSILCSCKGCYLLLFNLHFLDLLKEILLDPKPIKYFSIWFPKSFIVCPSRLDLWSIWNLF